MKISELSESKYLKKEDVGSGKLLTITELVQDEIEKEGKAETVHVLMFEEVEKGLVLKPTNASIIAKFLGDEETDNWVGKKVVLYNDPNIAFAGKITGGIRARAPRVAATAKPSGKVPAVASKTAQTKKPTPPIREREDVEDAAREAAETPSEPLAENTGEAEDNIPF